MKSDKQSIQTIIAAENDQELVRIAQKVVDEQRLDMNEGLYLYENGSLNFLGALANYVRERLHGDKTYFNRNFHIEPTNVCIYTCDFCSYSRSYKHREDGWELGIEEMMDIVRKYDNEPVT